MERGPGRAGRRVPAGRGVRGWGGGGGLASCRVKRKVFNMAAGAPGPLCGGGSCPERASPGRPTLRTGRPHAARPGPPGGPGGSRGGPAGAGWGGEEPGLGLERTTCGGGASVGGHLGGGGHDSPGRGTGLGATSRPDPRGVWGALRSGLPKPKCCLPVRPSAGGCGRGVVSPAIRRPPGPPRPPARAGAPDTAVPAPTLRGGSGPSWPGRRLDGLGRLEEV